MRMVATNDDLELVEVFDLGDKLDVKGPDQDRFNFYITTESSLTFMEYETYTKKVTARDAAVLEKQEHDLRDQADRRKALQVVQ